MQPSRPPSSVSGAIAKGLPSDVGGALDRSALLLGDDERLLRGEEALRGLVVDMHSGETLAVELRVSVGRSDPDVFAGGFLEPHRCAR